MNETEKLLITAGFSPKQIEIFREGYAEMYADIDPESAKLYGTDWQICDEVALDTIEDLANCDDNGKSLFEHLKFCGATEYQIQKLLNECRY
jgi:hypothetical protein